MRTRETPPEAADGSRPGSAEPSDFVNPWADCWGRAGGGKARSSLQMQPEQTLLRHAKMEALLAEPEPCDEHEVASGLQADGAIVRVLPIVNNKGLHARASAKFVQTVERFSAEVTVSRCGETVGGLSIMGLMMLAAARGTSVTVSARGTDAEACMDAVAALLANKFGEDA
jgi:phosphocarrier protein HPr